MSSDGRLVIMDEVEEEGRDGDSDSSDVDDVTSTMSQVAIGRKRKMSSASSEVPAKYQGGFFIRQLVEEK